MNPDPYGAKSLARAQDREANAPSAVIWREDNPEQPFLFLYRCIACHRERPESHGYRVRAGFICQSCAAEFES